MTTTLVNPVSSGVTSILEVVVKRKYRYFGYQNTPSPSVERLFPWPSAQTSLISDNPKIFSADEGERTISVMCENLGFSDKEKRCLWVDISMA